MLSSSWTRGNQKARICILGLSVNYNVPLHRLDYAFSVSNSQFGRSSDRTLNYLLFWYLLWSCLLILLLLHVWPRVLLLRLMKSRWICYWLSFLACIGLYLFVARLCSLILLFKCFLSLQNLWLFSFGVSILPFNLLSRAVGRCFGRAGSSPICLEISFGALAVWINLPAFLLWVCLTCSGLPDFVILNFINFAP